MKKLLVFSSGILLLVLSCSSPCELSEEHIYSWSQGVLDRGFNKYDFVVTFLQDVKVYTGDCAEEKYLNETRLKILSKAPCDQKINLAIKVGLGADSYEFTRNELDIKSNTTVDFGVIWNNGPRIDFADIDIAIYCPLCPGDGT